MKKSILPIFQNIQLEAKIRRFMRSDLRQPLIKYREANKKLLQNTCSGFKDLSMNYQDSLAQNSIMKVLNLIPTIHPQSHILFLWNIILELTILYNFFMAPIIVSFTQQAFITDQTGMAQLNILSLVIFYIDFIVRANLGFYRRQRLIQAKKDILIHYFKNQFFFDIISTISLTIYCASKSYSLAFARFGVYLKFPSLATIDDSILQKLSRSAFSLLFYKVLRMIAISWLLTTWGACIYFIIDYSYYIQPQSDYYRNGLLWLKDTSMFQNIDIIKTFPQWYVWYQYALYWSVQTSVTMGYGNLTSKNPPQIVLANIFMILMTILFAYYVNYIFSCITQFQDSFTAFSEGFQLVKELKTLTLTYEQKETIYNEMKAIYQDMYEEKVKNTLFSFTSKQIKQQLRIAFHSPFFMKSVFPFYFRFFDLKILLKYIQLLQQVRYHRDQIIYSLGQLDLNFYYIQKGVIELRTSQDIQSPKSRVQAHEVFGESEFFFQVPRVHIARTCSFAKVKKLNYQKLCKCSKSNEQMQIFFQVIHEIKIEGSNRKAEDNCWVCKQRHPISKCNPFFKVGNQEIIEKSRSFQLVQPHRSNQRNKITRREIKSKKELGNNEIYNSINCDVVKNYQKYRSCYNSNSFS